MTLDELRAEVEAGRIDTVVLEHANTEHRRIVKCLRGGDGVGAIRILRDHLAGTEHIIAGLIPPDAARN